MQDEIPRNPRRQKALHTRDVEAAKSASVQELIANARTRELVTECEEMIDRLAIANAYEALVCQLMLVSGLRLKEVMSLKPYESMLLGGLHIKQGTKDGKSRYIPFSKLPSSALRQHEVYSRCLEYAKTTDDGSMKYKGRCKDASLYYCRIEKVLASHRDPTATFKIIGFHFRLAYIRNLFEDCMVYRQSPESQEAHESTDVNALNVQAAIRDVMHALGHYHPYMTIHYLGWPYKTAA